MKVRPSLLLLVALPACWGPHIATGSAPNPPAATFACMTQAVADLGYKVLKSEPATGFLRAEKRDLGSPDSSEYSELTISVYTDRDHNTQYMVTATRTQGGSPGARSANGLFVEDADTQASDEVIKRCTRQ